MPSIVELFGKWQNIFSGGGYVWRLFCIQANLKAFISILYAYFPTLFRGKFFLIFSSFLFPDSTHRKYYIRKNGYLG